MKLRDIACAVASALSLLAAAISHAEDATPYDPPVSAASDEGENAKSQFRVPEGVSVELFAAEPLLANPVTFCIDEQGQFYVGQSFRQGRGVEDNRGHMSWLHDDLALQTVEDREAMFRKHLGEAANDYAREQDRILLLRDTDADGKPDTSTIFADGFNNIVDGTGAGLLARRGDLYYTCIPKLWMLRDNDGDGKADVQRALHHGYGVRVAFRGHDMHGLCFGPDGKLYYSLGDRGYNVITQEGTRLVKPETGAVFRCNPDGSELEVVATGLRNPQELTFDDYGNLFTVDNNSDSGDKARLVYIVEGGDVGWRMYYQYLKDRGPWNREELWHPYHEGQPAYVLAPIVNIADGPSGLTHDPGVGLPEQYAGRFFLADFRGTAVNSGIRAFAVEPDGATFKLGASDEFLWSILATDVDFGYDGNLYVSDWVEGWTGPGKGRIYRFGIGDAQQKTTEARTARLMREGFERRSNHELVSLLGHRDRRVRQEAQFALAERRACDVLIGVARRAGDRFARLHAIWGLGQCGLLESASRDTALSLLNDRDAEVRAQAAKILGECRVAAAVPALTNLLKDENLHVRYFAATSLGKVGSEESFAPLLALLAENDNKDPILRHGGVMGLFGIGRRNPEALLEASKSLDSAAARLGVVLALRRLEHPAIAQYLSDLAPSVVLEAAIAIHDLPIHGALPALAAVPLTPESNDALARRVVNANFRLGSDANSDPIIAVASNDKFSEALRLEAISELTLWRDPPPIDRVHGDWRPLEKRPADGLAERIRPALDAIFAGSEEVRRAGAQLAATYGVKEAAPVLFEFASSAEQQADVRVDALRALETLGYEKLLDAANSLLQDAQPEVRSEARRLLAGLKPEEAVPVLADALEKGTTLERQKSLEVLAALGLPASDALLAQWLDRLTQGSVPPEIQLDVLEAARTRGTGDLKTKLEQIEATRPADDPLATYRVALAGGNASRGRDIFRDRSSVSCRRCHKIENDGGEVGPNLTKIGGEKDREYLLTALVAPNQQIAKGFESVVVVTVDGKVHTGIVRESNDTTLRLIQADGSSITIPVEEIEERASGKSAMPEDVIKHLSISDIRDLVEYLANLKG